MKRIALLCLVTMYAYPLSYTELKTTFKEGLCNFQGTLMKRDAYMALLDSYLVESEQKLVIPKEASKRADVQDVQPYFVNLAQLNVATFIYYVQPTHHNKDLLNSCKDFLLNNIKELCSLWNLNINPEKELQKTAELLIKANEDFYKTLSFSKRLKLRAQFLIANIVKPLSIDSFAIAR